MADPTPYTPNYDYSDFQAGAPTTPLPATQLDGDLAEISQSTVQLVNAVKDVRRSDGRLKNAIVTPESLSATTRALLPGDANPRGTWATATAYELKDLVERESATYIATTDHTSGDFDTDLAAGKWLLIASPYSLSNAVFSQTFDADGTTDEFTLSQSFSNIDELQVYVQAGTGGYELMRGAGTSPQVTLTGGTTLGFASAPASGTRRILVLAVNQTAATSAAAAAASAADAADEADAAAASASAAATSASNASTSASAAATAEGAAETAQAAAEAARDAALAAVGGVKVSGDDTTADDLETKLLASGLVGLSTQNGGGNETRTIDVPVASQAEAEAGTAEDKAMTPLRVAQAIAALTSAGGGMFKGNDGTVNDNAGADIFRVNAQTLTANTTIDSDENVSCAGPLTVDTGVTLTVNGNLVIL